MTTAVVAPSAAADRDALRRWAPWLVLGGGVLALQLAFSSAETFPAEFDDTFASPIDDGGAWMRTNRLTHPIFTRFFTPISDFIDWIISSLADFLLWAPWFVVIGLAVARPLRAKMWRESAVVAIALAYTGVFGLWEDTMRTLALMLAAVFLAVAIGLPLGVWGAFRPRAEQVMRPILDAMQTIPAFVYFLPLFMLFGIGNVPAAVATLIYALPPVVRLTTLGIKQVPSDAIEASAMFGATRLQTLLKVQLPMAIRTIVAGLSQTVMMALGIVVLTQLVGANGLGSPIMESLTQRRVGRGLAAGLAIVAIALVLDRISRSIAERDSAHVLSPRATSALIGSLLVALVAGRAGGVTVFPDVWDWKAFDPIDDWLASVRVDLLAQTRWLGDVIVTRLYLPPRDFLTDTVAWPVPVFVTGWVGWRLRGPGLAAFSVAALATIGLIGLWDVSINTLVQVVIATALSLAVAIPLGVWAGRNRRVDAVLSPMLDAAQTMPSLVYIIPMVFFFGVGVVPGIIATVVYAMVPGVRITALGIREVNEESIEASRTFGATPRQTMLGVRLPLAAPTIMVAVNQVIMMVLAMVIIAGLVGGGGLGFLVVESLSRSKFGQGIEVGLALVLMAMILDRFTEACSDRLRPPTAD